MAKDVAIITLHGMGTTEPDYYHGLAKKLRKAVGVAEWDERVHLEPVYYQDLLQDPRRRNASISSPTVDAPAKNRLPVLASQM